MSGEADGHHSFAGFQADICINRGCKTELLENRRWYEYCSDKCANEDYPRKLATREIEPDDDGYEDPRIVGYPHW